MKYHLMHPRDQLVNIMNRIYNGGMTTLSGGNLSIKDENGDIWITPAAVDKGKLRPQDIMCVHEDGQMEGPHRPSSEYPFHVTIYEHRPDLRAIVHAHPPALVSFSIAREVPDTSIIPQAQRVCGPVGYAPYALTGSQQLGDHIAATFGQGFDVVLLENHGIVTGGGNLLEAFQRLETLDFCARTLMQATGLGEVNTLTNEQLAPFDRRDHFLPEFTPAGHSSHERELRQQLVDVIHRAYDRQLMISTEGVASARVGPDTFLITPTGLDRRNLDIEDLVLVQNGRREVGKLPSRSVRLHQEVYQRRPEINCLILAQSPSAMAFAISSGHFDTRTIPESYILLRSIPRIRHGAQYSDPEEIAAALSLQAPVLIIENDSILVAGQHILRAFDRLEVAEFSARSLIDTATIGPMAPISGDDIAALERAFNLN